MFIQQPGRVILVRAAFVPVLKSKMCGVFAPVKRLKAQLADVERVAHLWLFFHFHPSIISPVRKSQAKFEP